jgi:hypothetical protein
LILSAYSVEYVENKGIYRKFIAIVNMDVTRVSARSAYNKDKITRAGPNAHI